MPIRMDRQRVGSEMLLAAKFRTLRSRRQRSRRGRRQPRGACAKRCDAGVGVLLLPEFEDRETLGNRVSSASRAPKPHPESGEGGLPIHAGTLVQDSPFAPGWEI